MDSLEQQLIDCDLTRTQLIYGGIAQLGERLHGMQEVNGSIPFTSTIFGGAVQVGKSQDSVFSPLRLEA
jgi:hypothetical protein